MSERLESLELGISPCPNDTFAFAGLLEGAVRCEGAELALAFDDVQAWNERLAGGSIDAAKGSFLAAVRHGSELAVLTAGGALGFGVGPLLLARPGAPPLDARARVLAPGDGTTAHLLFQLFHGPLPVEHTVFSRILPALAAGEADYGVCIHESRFTWQQHGLARVEDLGARWEERFGCALPLGGILFRKRRGRELAERVARAIEASLAWARAHPERALLHMRAHAQELSDDVLWAHVETYVGFQTLCLTHAARAALATLASEAARLGLARAPAAAPEVWGRREPLRIFHVLRREEDEHFELTGVHRPASLAREGFVHLSFESQLDETVRLHFEPGAELALLEVDADRAGEALRCESSRGGLLFPHLRRELRRADVTGRRRLAR